MLIEPCQGFIARAGNLNKPKVLILGAGRIGSLIACLLSSSKDYELELASRRPETASSLIDDLQLDKVTAQARKSIEKIDASRHSEGTIKIDV